MIRGARVDPAFIFENAPDPVFVFDRDSQYCIDVNAAALGWLGFSRVEFLASTIESLGTGEDMPVSLTAFGQLQPGSSVSGTWRLKRKSGEYVHANVRCSVAVHEGRVLVLMSARELNGLTTPTESESLLRAVQRLIGLGIWQLDPSTGTLNWSDNVYDIYGLPKEKFGNDFDSYVELVHPDDRDAMLGGYRNFIDSGEALFSFEHRVVAGNGRTIFVRGAGEFRDTAGGRVLGGVVQDVTDLTEARDRTEHLSRRLMDTLENMSDGFLALDRDWRVEFMNTQAEKLLNRPRDEVLGRVVWDEFPEAAGSRFQLQYESAMRSGRTARFVEYFAPLSKWFEVSAYPAPESLGVYFRDITDRQAAEEAMRISDERFRIVAKATNDVIWDWDLKTQSVWWNEGMNTLFGYDRDTLEPGPESWSERIHPDDHERVLRGIFAVIDGSDSNWQDEYRFVHASGRVLTIMDRGYVIRDETGNAVRMIGSMNDLTERRELDDRLRQSQKLEAIGQITGGVAHDFNNLLTVILGNADLLAEQLTDRQQLRLMAEMTANAAERGAELTARLLAFARRQALAPQPVNVNRLVKGMDGLLRRTLTENIDIEIVQAGGLWVTSVDPGQLEVALLNLAINARDAMPGGGCLTIETANAKLDDAYARAHDEVSAGQYVMISVSDTGFGMPSEVVQRAFEPFFTTKEVGKGSGLGLSMVYGFVKQSGGHVKIYAEPEHGTTVKLYFPRNFDEMPATDTAEEPPLIATGRETILVVEDDELVRGHLISQLRDLGYEVSGAASGVEALALLQRGERYDLLFTDVVMPGMNGRQLVDEARRIAPRMRVLFTSGYSENAIVHHGRLDHGVQLLSKPYRRQELALKVRDVLDGPVR